MNVNAEIVLQDKTVAVTGATGFIGRHLVERLIRGKNRVRAVVRTPPKAAAILPESVEVVSADVTDPDALRQAFAGIDIVFHLANVIPGRRDTANAPLQAVNVNGTRNAAVAALDNNVHRFVHVSSIAVYGAGASGQTDESSPHEPGGDPYGVTKDEGEQIVRRLAASDGLPAIIVQPGATYGPHDRTWTLKPLELLLERKLILPGGGKGLMQPLYITDLADGLVRAAERGRTGEAYILVGAETITVGAYFRRLAALVDRNRIPSIPMWSAFGLAAVAEAFAAVTRTAPLFTRDQVRYVSRRAVFDSSTAREELGFAPAVSLDTGIEKVGQWLESTNALESHT